MINPVYRPQCRLPIALSRCYPVLVVIRSYAVAVVALLLPIAAAQQIPVLTVCEALHELPKHNGKLIIVVGRSFFSFEGSFMNEECEPDGRTTVQGRKWLSMIAFGPRDSREPIDVRWDPDVLTEKLRQVQQTTRLQSPNSSPSIERWTAVYGRLEAPQELRTPSSSGRRYRAGNGYGANGTVPAQLHTITEYNFPR